MISSLFLFFFLNLIVFVFTVIPTISTKRYILLSLRSTNHVYRLGMYMHKIILMEIHNEIVLHRADDTHNMRQWSFGTFYLLKYYVNQWYL